MGSAAILVVNSFFESISGEGEVSHSQKTTSLLCFRLKRKALYLGYGGGPIVELSVCCKRKGLDPGSERDPRFWGEGRAVLLISEQGEAGDRATQMQVSVPAPSSATASPPSIMWSITASQTQRLQHNSLIL